MSMGQGGGGRCGMGGGSTGHRLNLTTGPNIIEVPNIIKVPNIING